MKISIFVNTYLLLLLILIKSMETQNKEIAILVVLLIFWTILTHIRLKEANNG